MECTFCSISIFANGAFDVGPSQPRSIDRIKVIAHCFAGGLVDVLPAPPSSGVNTHRPCPISDLAAQLVFWDEVQDPMWTACGRRAAFSRVMNSAIFSMMARVLPIP